MTASQFSSLEFLLFAIVIELFAIAVALMVANLQRKGR